MKRQLLAMVDRDRDLIVRFIRDFVRCASPNPPGNTIAAARHITEFLGGSDLAHEVVSPHPEMPNILASTTFGAGGRHLVLNGHIDVFPVEDEARWTHGPWDADLIDGKIYGRGVADMKVGTAAAIMTYRYLAGLAGELKGKVTLAAVSDEETFGPWGARYLFENRRADVLGDACLIGEPSSAHTVRFGEKGSLWMRFRVRTKGAHGAYTHLSDNAILVAQEVIGSLLELRSVSASEASNLSAALDAAAAATDRAYGKGAAENVRRITVNIGRLVAGSKVNMVPSDCTFEVDFRIPIGLGAEDVDARVEQIVARVPQLEVERLVYNPPSWSPPDAPLLGFVQKNAAAVCGIEPVPVVALTGTDARLWRYHNVPAIVYGPAPRGMGSHDEHVEVEEVLNVVKCHLLSAWDYLTMPA